MPNESGAVLRVPASLLTKNNYPVLSQLVELWPMIIERQWQAKCLGLLGEDIMADKRLEKEEEEQAEDARSEEDLDTLSVKGASASRVATEEMIEDDEVVNRDQDDLNDLEDEEEEAAEDAETSAL